MAPATYTVASPPGPLSVLRSCSAPPSPGCAPPYIPTSSPQWLYALHRINGYGRQGACQELNIVPETARRWERDLRAVGTQFFGREVTYDFAARYATDAGFRDAYSTLLNAESSSV